MDEFNAYQNHGRYYAPTKPSKDEEELKAEKAAILDQVPVLKEVIKHFDDQIKHLKSLDSIDVPLDKPEILLQVMAANKLAVQKLRQEKGFIKAKIDKLR